MKTPSLTLHLVLFMLAYGSLAGQRFSFLSELGGLRGQIDGDNIDGFYYNGFTLGFGSNYTISNDHFISVKTSYYSQGSRRSSDTAWDLGEGLQIEMDLNSVGLEIGYKYAPKDKFLFGGISYVRHQLVSSDYKLFLIQTKEGREEFDPTTIRSGFNSVKSYYGLDLFPRASIYGAFEISYTNLLESNYLEVERILPYSLSLVFSYEILAAKEIKVNARPGSKTRPRR